MKQYLSIGRECLRKIDIYAFDKLDGSNVRAEWHYKKGFTKFGSRKVLIDGTHPMGDAVDIIQKKYVDDLSKIFRKQRYGQVTCFFEYLGPNSFAGQHEDEEHDVVLLDLDVYKKGLINPKEYLKLVGHLDIAKYLYWGKANELFERAVRDSELEGVTFEGVVCKAPNPKKTPQPVMFKIKSKAWIGKLKEFCRGDEKLMERLL